VVLGSGEGDENSKDSQGGEVVMPRAISEKVDVEVEWPGERTKVEGTGRRMWGPADRRCRDS
jgi:hypothetical protein